MKRSFMFTCVFVFFSMFAFSQWGSDPTENTLLVGQSGEQVIPHIGVTSQGNFFVSWFTNENGNYAVRMQHYDINGIQSWADNGILLQANASDSWLTDYSLAVDNQDNAICTFSNMINSDAYAFKISETGEYLWGTDGIRLSQSPDYDFFPQVIVTPDNNTIVAWQKSGTSETVIMHKIAPDGTLLWGANGINIASTTPSIDYNYPKIVATGNDDVILVYEEGTGMYDRSIVAQRYNSAGQPVWPQTLSVETGGGVSFYAQPQVITDNNNGFFVTWVAERDGGLNTYIQYVSGNGVNLWQPDGVSVSTQAGRIHVNPSVTYNAQATSVFIFWIEANSLQTVFGLSGQKFNANGERQWTDNGKTYIPLSSTFVTLPNVRSASRNVLVTYEHFTFGSGEDSKTVAMMVNANGGYVWSGETVSLCNNQSQKVHAVVTDMTNNQFLSVWEDNRNGVADLYGQNINTSGELGAFCFPPSIPSLPSGSTNICQNTVSTNYTVAAVQGASSYSWNFFPNEAGTFSSQNNTVTVTWNNSFVGTAYLKVKSINSFGESAYSDSLEITVSPLPVVSLGDTIFVCEGTEIVLDAGAGFSSYLWNNGISTQTLTVSQQGTYSVLVTNANGCSGSDSIYVGFNPKPEVVFTVAGVNQGDSVFACEGTEIILDAGAGFTAYQWNDNSTQQTLTALLQGTYSVTVTNASGCLGSDSIFVGFETKPEVAFTMAEDTICNYGDTIRATNQTVGANAYLWKIGNLTFTTENLEVASGFQIGVWNSVSLTATSTYGCVDSLKVAEAVFVTVCESVENQELANAIKINNLSDNRCEIRIESDKLIKNNSVKINLINVSGQIIRQEKMNINSKILDFSNYSKGIYYLQVVYNQSIITKKVIIY